MSFVRKYFVINGENCVSWSANKDESECFKTYNAARKRAAEIAESEPGTEVLICETRFILRAAVNPVTIDKLE